MFFFFFFFSSRRRHTRWTGDWSSDVCSSDLVNGVNESDYDAAVNLVESTKADIDYTQALIDKTIVRAPFDGTIGLRQVSPGAYVSPTMVLATLQQLGKLKVDFNIPEEYSNLIKVGNT